MEYKLVAKPQFTLVGYARKFNSQTSYKEIPEFWNGLYFNKGARIAEGDEICGEYGVCYDVDDMGGFTYMIADHYDPGTVIPNGAEVIVVPAHTWAIFECHGSLPDSLQQVNTYIFNEWLPNSKQYRMSGDLNIEAYFDAIPNNSEDDYSEIWIPVEEI